MLKKALTITFLLFTLVGFASCTKQGTSTKIIFGDLSWNSAQIHNRIAAFIIENGYSGYTVDYIAGDTLPIINGVLQGDIDVDMESWHSNFRDVYDKGMASGDMVDLGKNLPDAPQGWWIPRYVIEGADAKAPNLTNVNDLPKYANLFPDPENKSKGVVYGGVAGWSQLTISEKIFKEAGLESTFNLTIAGSGSALAATMVGAYEKGEAWIGYYWAPTAVLGKLDMVRLKGSEYEPADVNILVNKSMLEKAPDVVEFLKNYSTTVDDNNEFLAKMDEHEWDTTETAKWFLQNKEDVWTKWVSDDVAQKVKAALKE